MNDKRIKQEVLNFYRLVLALQDIKFARKAIEQIDRLISDTHDELLPSLFFALVISYARPFQQGTKIGPMVGEWTRFPEGALTSLHSEILRWRNSLVAHNDPEHVSAIILPPGTEFRTDPESAEPLFVADEIAYAVQYSLPHLSRFKEFARLIGYQEDRMRVRIGETKDTVLASFILPGEPFNLPLDEILKLA